MKIKTLRSVLLCLAFAFVVGIAPLTPALAAPPKSHAAKVKLAKAKAAHLKAVKQNATRRKKAPRTAGNILSIFSTNFNPGKTKRVHNLKVALKRVSNIVLKPGQVFSLNATAKERTHENGYLTAPVLENKKLVPGLGGGVSQVAGTLFNAALLAGLKIVQYIPHSRPVAYLPFGRDATLVWGSGDLKIKNNTSSPIRIACRLRGNRCVAAVYGKRVPGKTIRLGVQKKRLGPTHVLATLFRITKKKGKIVLKEKIGTADYNWKKDNED